MIDTRISGTPCTVLPHAAMFLNAKPAKIKQKVVNVPKPAPATKPVSQSRPLPSRTNSGPPTNRYQVTQSAQSKPRAREAARSLAVSKVEKRKVSPSTPQWASSDDESEEDDDRSGKRRRTAASSSTEPTNLNRTLEPDLSRRIRIQEAVNLATNTFGKKTEGDASTKKKVEKDKSSEKKAEDAASTEKKMANGAPEKNATAPIRRGNLIHGLSMSRGDEAKNYKPVFTDCDKVPILQLQYPSPSRPEKFEAVTPLDVQEGYTPLEDIYFSIEEIIQHYLPPDLATELSSDTEGTVRLLKRAVHKNSPSLFQEELSRFNTLIKDRLADCTISRIMDSMHAIPLNLVKCITAQSYGRVVSPQAHRLRKVKGKETTYGELLTTFVHKIFQQTGLNSSQVFVDLGSGVGNVVLQAALQTGAESWGIEKMPLAASLGSKQASELQARARLWNISLGDIHLIAGDFLETPEIDDVLRRADVVLVNNKVFGEELNNNLLQKFLDLKDGCKVVSLESFGGGAKQGVRHEQAIAGLFDEERFESGTNSVSWAGESVEWFVATKAR